MKRGTEKSNARPTHGVAVRRAIALALMLCVVLGQAACESRINQENFQKIKNGMTEDEVTKILGEPSDAASMSLGPFSGTTSTWKSKNGTIAIQFVNGKVALKTFTKGGEEEKKK